ncbi:hypothetical protein DWB85_07615 [Seongchinamella sediminis]|uniref:Uncharacterized protein n=1 Tax=Seongchinamella sediminis TaxID=2283635 RepID=A0A3L7E0M5_9GAMM|nr:hypothetical protein [Seongchinamella sediminis]RLQ22479.1 hypothetical protein DWB85_07615 [Seongchinamella sediminis]
MATDWSRLLLAVGLLPALARADGSVIDKVYHPYVEQLEWELEWRLTHADENPQAGTRGEQLHRLGLGRAVSEFVFVEAYLIGSDRAGDDLDLAAYELEVLWQLSEQGEYALDYGLLFELEKEHQEDVWEYATVLLLEREFGRFSGTANLGVIYEWGEDIADELETSLALQARYRYSPRLEPALELYSGEDTLGMGPVLMGMEKLGPMRALRWEAGVVLGLDSDSADYTLRAVLEYEF